MNTETMGNIDFKLEDMSAALQMIFKHGAPVVEWPGMQDDIMFLAGVIHDKLTDVQAILERERQKALAIRRGSADAKLLELGHTMTRLVARSNKGGLSDEEMGSLLDEQAKIERQIIATPATTMAGLAVKMRIATDNLDVEEDGTPCHNDGKAALSALKDAERHASPAT